MDPEAVKKSLTETTVDAFALQSPCFFDTLVNDGLRIDLVEPGRVLCSYAVPPRLSGPGNYLHGGVVATLVDVVGSSAFLSAGLRTTGVSLDINVSYLDVAFIGEEIEIDAKVLRAGKTVGVVSVEVRKKGSGKLIAQGRHSKYLAVSSKL
ncbi:acyl-coenzyme A thioesterase 13 [Canna indica]|uniref:Acyl-coenzyme A thioesterase 13 n=1 Tax=Canna indica TaxID=4628 RepID=A0AAQ3QA54_9LILI|nr:acyl-coenzyme A thioesterase 13 [Canna indica]